MGGKITADKITADKITADKITADKIMADKITADKIMGGKIKAAKITIGSMTSDKNIPETWVGRTAPISTKLKRSTKPANDGPLRSGTERNEPCRDRRRTLRTLILAMRRRK